LIKNRRVSAISRELKVKTEVGADLLLTLPKRLIGEPAPTINQRVVRSPFYDMIKVKECFFILFEEIISNTALKTGLRIVRIKLNRFRKIGNCPIIVT
jgi:hypothetical protein